MEFVLGTCCQGSVALVVARKECPVGNPFGRLAAPSGPLCNVEKRKMVVTETTAYNCVTTKKDNGILGRTLVDNQYTGVDPMVNTAETRGRYV